MPRSQKALCTHVAPERQIRPALATRLPPETSAAAAATAHRRAAADAEPRCRVRGQTRATSAPCCAL
eukprot:7292784-Prymnesium_polylepis.1